jgi:excisionase family DNA binding protein
LRENYNAMQESIFNLTKRDLENIIEDRVRYCLLTYSPEKSAQAVPTDTEQLLTKRQAADLIGVCTSTIDNNARAGKLTRRYVGRSVRFRRDDVLSLAEAKQPRQAGQSLLNGKNKRA